MRRLVRCAHGVFIIREIGRLAGVARLVNGLRGRDVGGGLEGFAVMSAAG